MLSMMSAPKQPSQHLWLMGRTVASQVAQDGKAILHQTLMCSVITVKGSDMLKLTAGLKEVGRKGKDQDTGNPRRLKSQLNLLLLQTVNQLMKICSRLPVPPTSQPLLMPLLSLNPDLVHVL